MMRWLRSLQAKYMLIILMALILVQAGYLLVAIALTISQKMQESTIPYYSPTTVEQMWHEDAGQLTAGSREQVRSMFASWQAQYPEAAMFWVDGDDRLVFHTDEVVPESLPIEWSATFTAQYIKSRYNGDPFTVIAFVGNEPSNGFVVFELPRSSLEPPVIAATNEYGTWLIVGLLVIIALFILISFLFFRGIRKRLLQLQEAMTIRDVDGLPVQINVKKQDEIGQLEQSFNDMVFELRESRQREQEEEQLRRELIANLSHDLRTPLTKVRAHVYSIGQENLSNEGQQAVQSMESSVVNMDRLIENLMSYTLLMANKYKYEPKPVDIVRFVREHVATWYPAFEKASFEIDIELQPLQVGVWHIDPLWMGRILDNLFQNVLRHAKHGRYVGVRTETSPSTDAIIIIDRGSGMGSSSEEQGAGIGMSIVDRMVKGMELEWVIDSGSEGTIVKIIRATQEDN